MPRRSAFDCGNGPGQQQESAHRPFDLSAPLISNRLAAGCLGLVLALTAAVYWPVSRHDFIDYDDNVYIYENSHVRAGLTWEGVRWAFVTGHTANWHPVTWLSHMLDCELYGLQAGRHHVTSVLFHLANAALLYFLLRRITGAAWRSVFAVALFALHPLRVESVAWIAERKDVLSAFFWLLTMLAYTGYVRSPAPWRYLLMLFYFICGLMSKPMLVTLPFVLLLLDAWPLNRLGTGTADEVPIWRSCARLIGEKIPMFLLVAASCIVTFAVQKQGGAVLPVGSVSLSTRMGNVVVSYVEYIWKFLWPARLAVFYPLEGRVFTWPQLAGAAGLLALVSLAAYWRRKRQPYLLVGWCWYLGSLVPVIGLVQVGVSEALADRYTYIPLIGIVIMIVWSIGDWAGRWRALALGTAMAAAAWTLALTAGTAAQISLWRNGETLFTHSLSVTRSSSTMHFCLSVSLWKQGKLREASAQIKQALALEPSFAMLHVHHGLLLAGQGRTEEAMAEYREAIRLNPNYFEARNNLALLLGQRKQFGEAMAEYAEAIRINPGYAEAYNNMGGILFEQGKTQDALSNFSKAVELNPYYIDARLNLATALNLQGRSHEATQQLQEVLRLDPGNQHAHRALGQTRPASP